MSAGRCRGIALTISGLSPDEGRELLVGLERLELATERRSKLDADVAAALVRILIDETRGTARGRAHEARELLKEMHAT